MESLTYFWPENVVAQVIVLLLLGGFFCWLAYLQAQVRRLKRNLAEINSCKDVSVLAAATNEHVDNSENLPTPGKVLDPFVAFCKQKHLSVHSPIRHHLEVIYNSGVTGAHLDAGQLLSHSLNELFHVNNSLRSVLSTFIIVGLFGTLFGLAESLSRFALGPQAIGGATPGLQSLLESIKTAFAPSLVGVLFTIIGVLRYSRYSHHHCEPLRMALERETFTTWIPALIPSLPQHALIALERSASISKESLQAAETVAKLAKDIQSDAEGLGGKLKSANKVLSLTTESATKLNEFSGKFVDAAGKITSFQAEIRGLYRQMSDSNTEFQKNINAVVMRAEEFQKSSFAPLIEQNTKLSTLNEILNRYEQAYITQRGEIDKKLLELLTSAKGAFDGIETRNKEIIGALAELLKKDLKEDLGRIESALTGKLGSLDGDLKRMEAPLASAASKFEGSVQTFEQRVSEHIRTLKQDFENQNNVNAEQTKKFTALSEALHGLLREMSGQSADQKRSLDQVGAGLSTFSANMVSLNRTMVTLAGSTEALARAIPDLHVTHKDSSLIAIFRSLMQWLRSLLKLKKHSSGQ